MNCPICGSYCEDHTAVKYLPRFFRCPCCSGCHQHESEPPSYSSEYFIAESSPIFLGMIFQKIFSMFLFLKTKKIRKLFSSRDETILDYGCGNGKFVKYLRQRGFCAEGYDPSSSAVALAQENKLPVFGYVPDKRYDLIVFWHSLEHVDQPLKDLMMCQNYLKPSGKILIAVPNADSLEARIAGRAWFCYDWPFHRVHFTPKSLKFLLTKAGFRILSADYFNPEYTFSSLVQTFLNLFLGHNVLYSVASNRRLNQKKSKALALAVFSFCLLAICFPFLFLFFLLELLTKKTAAIIVFAEKA